MSESQATSDYPGALDTWETLTDKEDLAEVVDINKIKAALLAIQTELGVNPAGSLATVLARLAMIQNVDGAFQKGTAFPVSGLVDGQAFYRTDQNVLYVYNGSTWDAQGQSLSNVVFSFDWGSGDLTANSYGYTTDSSTLVPAAATLDNYGLLWGNFSETYQVGYRTKFKKISGIQTVTIYLRAHVSAGTGTYQATIGTATGTQTQTATTPGWITISVDVSGLSDGTVYDVTMAGKGSGGGAAYMNAGIGIAS